MSTEFTLKDLNKYEQYLDFLHSSLDKFFESQKPYIFCQKGCAKCCKNAVFPFSQLEVTYLMQKALSLDIQTRNKIDTNIANILGKRKDVAEFNDFKYDCPFLIDNACSVYENRGIVCRTFGLLEKDGEKIKIPFCAYEGLNYSNVLDKENDKFSEEKIMQIPDNIEIPEAFNINYNFLTSEKFEKAFNIKFGDKKPLINWFCDQEKPSD